MVQGRVGRAERSCARGHQSSRHERAETSKERSTGNCAHHDRPDPQEDLPTHRQWYDCALGTTSTPRGAFCSSDQRRGTHIPPNLRAQPSAATSVPWRRQPRCLVGTVSTTTVASSRRADV
jgi:hypothetical protein